MVLRNKRTHIDTHQYPLVSLVSINYNGTDVTRELLHSLQQLTYPSIEIILVDNNSADKSYVQLKDEFPEITLLQMPENLGFSGGNNAGIIASKGELILLINNDVEVTPGFLEPLIEVFLKDPGAGMASPKIVYFDRGETIQYAGSTGISPWTGRGKKTGYMEVDRGEHDYIRETALVHGACLMVSKRMITQVGMMPEDYFVYYEEHDWATRAKRQGFKLYYVGTSKVYHKGSTTIGKQNPLKTYYMTRNRLLYLRRNVSYPAFIISLLIFLLVTTPKHILMYSAKSDFNNLKAYIRGILWHMGNKVTS